MTQINLTNLQKKSFKNPKVLYVIIGILSLIIIALSIYFTFEGLIAKSDDQKWVEIRPLIIDDAKLVNVSKLTKEEFGKRSNERLKLINCDKIVKLSEIQNCSNLKKITTLQAQSPDLLNKGDSKVANSDDLVQSALQVLYWDSKN